MIFIYKFKSVIDEVNELFDLYFKVSLRLVRGKLYIPLSASWLNLDLKLKDEEILDKFLVNIKLIKTYIDRREPFYSFFEVKEDADNVSFVFKFINYLINYSKFFEYINNLFPNNKYNINYNNSINDFINNLSDKELLFFKNFILNFNEIYNTVFFESYNTAENKYNLKSYKNDVVILVLEKFYNMLKKNPILIKYEIKGDPNKNLYINLLYFFNMLSFKLRKYNLKVVTYGHILRQIYLQI